MGYYNTFVVKIWCDDSRKTIRGHIQHVSSRQFTHFLGLANMTDFIVSHLEPPANNATTQDERQGGLSLLAEGIGDIDG